LVSANPHPTEKSDGTVFRLLLGSDTFTVNVGNTTLHSLTWNGGQWHIEFVDRRDHLRGL
jgi:hypothetical protein